MYEEGGILVKNLTLTISCAFTLVLIMTLSVAATGIILIPDPEGVEIKQKRVLFSHPKHEAFECIKCHHTSDGANVKEGCKDAGCHDLFVVQTPAQRREISFFEKAYHDLCTGCHRELRSQEKPFGPIDCKGCHTQD